MKISKQNAEHYVWGGLCDGWHLVKQDGLSVIHERMQAGASEVRHYHERARQFFFMLAGTATLEIDGVPVVLGPSDGVEVPPLTPHQMLGSTVEAVEFLVISSPTTRGDRVTG
ncbi:cupin domain-containing protein [Paenibacillus montanisoli]|uniref:Cupin domain-containing protein n=1 Tax=Paenibacillus montanisoli TaxID=2081970 RepID=A0A328TWS1_9BACL|nr:cupin domain-containing protein [Paenibacillus montanisoli]RAP74132.1 cupin domain-containing protein [Paenibacillus montanisoli]